MLRVYWFGVKPKRDVAARGGIGAEDVVTEAVARALDGRRPCPEKVEAYPFLRGVVDSLISHMAESAERRLTRGLGSTTDDEESTLDLPAKCEHEPLDFDVEHEEAAQFRQLILAAADKVSLAAGILECGDAGIDKPCEIAEYLGVPVEDIYAARKKLTQMFGTAQRKHRKQRPES